MSKDKLIRRYISVTNGMRGYFPVLIGVFKCEHREYPEPILTGITCKTFEQAVIAAKEWAEAEEIPFE